MTENDDINGFKRSGLPRTPPKPNLNDQKQSETDEFSTKSNINTDFFHEFPPKSDQFQFQKPQSPDNLSFNNKYSDPEFVTQRKKFNTRINISYEIFHDNKSIELDRFSINLNEHKKLENYRPIIESGLKSCFIPLSELDNSQDSGEHSENKTPYNSFFNWSIGSNMAAIPIKSITDLIKEYKGDEKELNTFIKNIDKLWNYIATYEQNDKAHFMLVLQLNLTKKAAEATKNTDFNDWADVKKALLENINPQKNVEKAELKLSTVKQLPKEEIEKYAKRVEELMENLNKSLDLEGNNDIIKNQNDRKARKAFENGLIDQKLKNQVISRGTKTLRDSIDYVIEQELRQTELNPNKIIEKFCNYCKIKNHDISECRKLQARNSVNSQNFPNKRYSENFSKPNTSENSSNTRKSEIICYKCNQKGHIAPECKAPREQSRDKIPSTSQNTPPNSPRKSRYQSENGRMRFYNMDSPIEEISENENENLN